MKYLPKNAHKLKGEELAKLLFPEKALAQIKQELEAPKKKRSK
jgi:hypothetical protein